MGDHGPATKRVVVWDLHGVLVSGEPSNQDLFAESVGLDTSSWSVIRREYLDAEKAWDRVERGEMTLDQFAMELSRRINLQGGSCEPENAKYIWGNPNPFRSSVPNAVIMGEIASRRFDAKQAIATNNVLEWRPIWRLLVNLDLFDWVFDSSEIGHRKPEASFWMHVERVTGVTGADVMLVDDRLENVLEARDHGWRGVYFTEPHGCLSDIALWLTE